MCAIAVDRLLKLGTIETSINSSNMDADTIIVGGGIVGLWTAYHLASQGLKTILFEQFPYPHTRGSSHGQSRITRTSYSAPEYSAMMPEAHRYWKDLENHAERQLLVPMGLVSVHDMKVASDSFYSMLNNLKTHRIKHSIIDGVDIKKKFSGLHGTSDDKALFEAEAGLLRADNCLIALQNRYREVGGDLHDGEQVVSLNPINDTKVEVKTSLKTYTCKSVVLTCGAYINELLSTVNFRVPIQPVKALVCYWKSKRNEEQYSLKNGFPAAIFYTNDKGHFYCIPSYEYPGLIKICYHGGPDIDPHRRDIISPGNEETEQRLMTWLKKQISKHYTDVDASSPAIQEFCMYSESPDSKNILDFHPRHKNIVIGTGFSGSGFKTAPSVGKILASMATGKPSPYPLKPFSLKRFDVTSKM